VAKPLNSLQLQAAELIASGASESEVAAVCRKSRSWVQTLKRREDFQVAVTNAKERAKQIIESHSEKSLTQDLETFRKRFAQAADLLYESAALYLEKMKERIELDDAIDLPPSRIAQSLKLGAESLNLALDLGQKALGLDEIIDTIHDFKEISPNGSKATNGHKSISTRSEVN
jgi:hypothetical protein